MSYPKNLHQAYHAHVYFTDDNFELAQELCRQAGEKFSVKVGRMHRQPIGPHPMGSCQITFGQKDFEPLIPWLDENRQGLTVLVHALTGDDLKDHTNYAYWLGAEKELDLSLFTSND